MNQLELFLNFRPRDFLRTLLSLRLLRRPRCLHELLNKIQFILTSAKHLDEFAITYWFVAANHRWTSLLSWLLFKWWGILQTWTSFWTQLRTPIRLLTNILRIRLPIQRFVVIGIVKQVPLAVHHIWTTPNLLRLRPHVRPMISLVKILVACGKRPVAEAHDLRLGRRRFGWRRGCGGARGVGIRSQALLSNEVGMNPFVGSCDGFHIEIPPIDFLLPIITWRNLIFKSSGEIVRTRWHFPWNEATSIIIHFLNRSSWIDIRIAPTENVFGKFMEAFESIVASSLPRLPKILVHATTIATTFPRAMHHVHLFLLPLLLHVAYILLISLLSQLVFVAVFD